MSARFVRSGSVCIVSEESSEGESQPSESENVCLIRERRASQFVDSSEKLIFLGGRRVLREERGVWTRWASE